MWGLREWRKAFRFPFPPLVCGPPSTIFEVMLCKFRNREGMEMFCRVGEKKKKKILKNLRNAEAVRQSGWLS